MRAALIIVSLLALSGCAPTQPVPAPSSTEPASTDQPVSLQTYGFALIDCGYDDPLDSSATTDYLDEVAAFSNAAQLCVFGPEERVDARLERMGENGVQALLSVQDLFFEGQPDASTGSGHRFSLRADYEQRWNSFVAVNSLAEHAAEIYAFYLADEPAYNGMPSDELDVVALLVKSTIPGAVTALIEAWPAVGQLVVPASIDLIGFDHYGVADPLADPGLMAEYEQLKSKRSSPTQQIIVVLDAQWLPFYGEAGFDPAAMSAVAENYFAFASADPDVVALIGYLWPSGLDDPEQLGARALPQSVLATYASIGERITGK